jgi:hypothetical protein
MKGKSSQEENKKRKNQKKTPSRRLAQNKIEKANQSTLFSANKKL